MEESDRAGHSACSSDLLMHTDRQTLKSNTLNTPSIHPYQRLISDPPQIQMEDSIRTDWCRGGKHRTLPSLNFWVFPYILQTQHQGRSPLANRHPRLGAIHSCWTNPPLTTKPLPVRVPRPGNCSLIILLYCFISREGRTLTLRHA